MRRSETTRIWPPLEGGLLFRERHGHESTAFGVVSPRDFPVGVRIRRGGGAETALTRAS